MFRRISVRPRFYGLLILFMLLCFGISCAVAQVRYDQVSEYLEQLKGEKLALMNRMSELNERLEYVRTDAYIEQVARDELNLLMPGEIRYVSN